MTKNFLCRFFGFVRLFFAIFLNVPKGTPSLFVNIAKEWMFKNSQRPPFYIFWHCATYRRPKTFRKKIAKIRIFFNFFPHAGSVEENTCHFEVLLLFLSLRYGAYMGRSRLVVKKHENELTFTQYKL